MTANSDEWEVGAQQALWVFLREELGIDRDDANVDEPLFSSGLLDSFALTALLAFAETRFGVTFESAEITEDKVDSVAAIAAWVKDLLREAASTSESRVTGKP